MDTKRVSNILSLITVLLVLSAASILVVSEETKVLYQPSNIQSYQNSIRYSEIARKSEVEEIEVYSTSLYDGTTSIDTSKFSQEFIQNTETLLKVTQDVIDGELKGRVLVHPLIREVFSNPILVLATVNTETTNLGANNMKSIISPVIHDNRPIGGLSASDVKSMLSEEYAFPSSDGARWKGPFQQNTYTYPGLTLSNYTEALKIFVDTQVNQLNGKEFPTSVDTTVYRVVAYSASVHNLGIATTYSSDSTKATAVSGFKDYGSLRDYYDLLTTDKSVRVIREKVREDYIGVTDRCPYLSTGDSVALAHDCLEVNGVDSDSLRSWEKFFKSEHALKMQSMDMGINSSNMENSSHVMKQLYHYIMIEEILSGGGNQ